MLSTSAPTPTEPPPPQGPGPEAQRRINEQLEALKRVSPDFSAADFKVAARGAFRQIQGAWTEADLRPVRQLLSDGVYSRFDTYLEMDRLRGRRNRVEDLEILGCWIAEALVEEDFQTVTAQIAARIVDRTVSLEDGSEISREPCTFTEWWSFMRRPGAPDQGASLGFDGKDCPSCGAPLDAGQVCRCEHCGALVNSGEYGWVLAEISQHPPERSMRRARLAGELRGADPSASVQGLEDRASVAIWAMMDGALRREPDRARRLLTERAHRALTRFYGDAERWYALVDVGVGDVELQRLLQVQGEQWAILSVRWSGKLALCSEAGVEKVIAELAPRRDEVELVCTPSGERLDRGLASAGCPRCGGPLERADQASCPWCEATLMPREDDWLMKDIDFLTAPIKELREQREAEERRKREELKELRERRRNRRR